MTSAECFPPVQCMRSSICGCGLALTVAMISSIKRRTTRFLMRISSAPAQRVGNSSASASKRSRSAGCWCGEDEGDRVLDPLVGVFLDPPGAGLDVPDRQPEDQRAAARFGQQAFVGALPD